MSQRFSRQDFQRWTQAQPKGRFERLNGEVIAMAPERWAHARLKARIWRAFDRELTNANLSCQAAPDGMTVEIDDDTDYEPGALINCGPPIPDDATAAPNPIVIVEVLSSATAGLDAGGKLADYFRVPSVQHTLLVRPGRPEVTHRRRRGDRIETLVVRQGNVDLDPPGITLSIEEIYRA